MKHLNFNDYLNFKLLNEPLPCNCQGCQEKYNEWEKERQKFKNYGSPLFFKKQEKELLEKIDKKIFPFKAIFAFAFSLFLIFGFLFLSNIKKANKIEKFEKEYLKLMEIYERPQLGDLEACSIIFENLDEGENI